MTSLGWKKKRLAVWTRDEGFCKLCNRAVSLEDTTLDHIIPRSKGGSNAISNLQASHSLCNNQKGDGSPRQVLPRVSKKVRRQRRWEAGSEGYPRGSKTNSKMNKLRGAVMDHITNENAKQILLDPGQTTDDKICLQKREEP